MLDTSPDMTWPKTLRELVFGRQVGRATIGKLWSRDLTVSSIWNQSFKELFNQGIDIPASSKRCIFSAFFRGKNMKKLLSYPKSIYFWLRAIFQQLHFCHICTQLCFWNGVFARPTGDFADQKSIFSRPYFFDILWRLETGVFFCKKIVFLPAFSFVYRHPK